MENTDSINHKDVFEGFMQLEIAPVSFFCQTRGRTSGGVENTCRGQCSLGLGEDLFAIAYQRDKAPCAAVLTSCNSHRFVVLGLLPQECRPSFIGSCCITAGSQATRTRAL